MKKLLVLMLVFAMASGASALPYFTVDAADYKDHYQSSDVITINLVDEGVIGFAIDAITDFSAGGTASGPQTFHPGFGFSKAGALNYEGMLVAFASASVTMVPPVGQSGVLYSFEYHVPDVTISTIIEIGTFYDDDNWLAPELYYVGGGMTNEFMPAVIHVVPEPTTIVLLGLGGLLLRRRK